jgi:hypothetical protein
LAEPTEITNVGGVDGVASEATLQSLVDITRRQSRDSASALRAEQRIREAVNKATKEGSKETGLLAKGMKRAQYGFDQLNKSLTEGQVRLSDMAAVVTGGKGVFQSLFNFVDASVDQFRELSQVGAGFGNSIVEMNKVAATSGMAMTEFYQTIQSNSETLRALGGNVTEGAKRFAELSKGLRGSDLGQRLFDLGFTTQAINDGFLMYSENMLRQGFLQRMTNAQLIEGSTDYLKQIDLLSKATGRSREELLAQSQDLRNNAQFQSIMARASAEGAGNFEKSIALVAGFLPQFAGDLVDISSGFEGSDLAIALNTMGGGAGQQLVAALQASADGQMSFRQFGNELTRLGPALGAVGAAMDPTMVGRLQAQGGPLAALFDAQVGLNRMGGLNIDAAIAAQQRQSTITELFARFEAAITSFSSFITEKFIESDTFVALEQLGTKITESFALLFGPEEADGSFKNASKGVKDFVATVDDWVNTNLVAPITTFVDEFTAHVQSGGAPIDFFKDKIRRAGNAIVDFFLGAVGENEFGEAGRGARQGGLISRVGEGIRKAFQGEGVTKYLTDSFEYLMDSAYQVMLNYTGIDKAMQHPGGMLGKVKDLIFGEGANEDTFAQNIMNSLTNAFETMDFSGLDPMINRLNYIFEGLILKLKENLNKSGLLGDWAVSDEQLKAEQLDYAIRGLRDGTATGEARNQAMRSVLSSSMETRGELSSILGGLTRGKDPEYMSNEEMSTIMSGNAYSRLSAGEKARIQSLLGNMNMLDDLSIRRIGTYRATGKTTEPKDTLAQIHAGERVLNANEAASVNGLPQAMSQLNTLTAQIRDLMVQQNNLTSQVNRGVRGMSNDYLKGAMV